MSVCRTLMPFRIVIRNYCVFTLRRPTHGELSEIMSHVYLFSHVFVVYVFLYLLNYITILYWKLSENYKHGRRNDQPICKNKGRNESNELNSNDLRFFRNNLGLVFHTTYSCIFHSCIFSGILLACRSRLLPLHHC